MLTLAPLLLLVAQASALLKDDTGHGYSAKLLGPSYETDQNPPQSSLNPSFFWPYDYLQAQTSVGSEQDSLRPVAEHSVPAFIQSAQGGEQSLDVTVHSHDHAIADHREQPVLVSKFKSNTIESTEPKFKKVMVEAPVRREPVVKTKEIQVLKLVKEVKEIPVHVYDMPPVPKVNIVKEQKEIPVYVYDMPPIQKVNVVKEEKEIPVYVYEMPPLPEIKPHPLPEMPEIVFEKYVLPEFKPPELPQFEPIKQIPIVFYEFPPMPEMQPMPEVRFPEIRLEKHILPALPEMKFDLPKMEPMKEIPIVMYELPPMQETKYDWPEFKMPKFRLEKYILPPLPKMKQLDLPKFNMPEEIPVVMYEYPPMPEVKPIEFKMPEFRVIKYHMPPQEVKPVEVPQLPEFKWPEVKVVKYEAPEIKPVEPANEIKLPEFKFVKYLMPPKEKFEFTLPTFKMPEFKTPEIRTVNSEIPEVRPLELPPVPEFIMPELTPIELPPLLPPILPPVPEFNLPVLPPAPEFKWPEIPPAPEFKWPEFPKLPEINLPDIQFHEYQPMPAMHYMPAPAMVNIPAQAMVNVPMPVAYNYPMVAMNQPIKSKSFGFSKFKSNHVPSRVYMGHNHGFMQQAGHGQNVYIQSANGQLQELSQTGFGAGGVYSGMQQQIQGFGGGQGFRQGYNAPQFYIATENVGQPHLVSGSDVSQGYNGPQFYVANENRGQPHLVSGGEVSQLYMADGNNGVTVDTAPEWLEAFQANLGSLQEVIGTGSVVGSENQQIATPTSEL